MPWGLKFRGVSSLQVDGELKMAVRQGMSRVVGPPAGGARGGAAAGDHVMRGRSKLTAAPEPGGQVGMLTVKKAVLAKAPARGPGAASRWVGWGGGACDSAIHTFFFPPRVR